MTTPTPVGPILDNLPKLPGLRDRIDRLNAADIRCPNHPEQQALDCPDCPSDSQARDEDERERLEAATAAGDACTERFPVRYRTADLTDVADVPELLAWVEAYRADPSRAPSLLLLGGTGSGKTHAGYAALRNAVMDPRLARTMTYRTSRWKALTHADLIASLRPRAAKDHDSEAELKAYQETDLLFVDDLGAIKATEFVEEQTYRLVNGRYEAMRPLIVTSNLPLADLKEAIGDRIASRLAQDSVRIVLTTPDRRRQRAA